MFTDKTKFPSLPRRLLLAASALLLAACEGDVSDDIAQEDSLEITLQQCEVVRGGVVGTPTDPVIIGGVETRACLLNNDVGQIEDVNLKSSHNFEPLVWVLDGVYEIGQSKTYVSLAEFQQDTKFSVTWSKTGVPLYAREGTVVVVHRNGSFSAGNSGGIASIDDNNTGGGEWAGVVVNGIGWHPDCGANASSADFCNLEGDWGYFGGLSQAETSEAQSLLDKDTGFTGYVAEAGGEPASGVSLTAALTFNAPHRGRSSIGNGVYYSAKSGLELNGGAAFVGTSALGNQGHAILWHSGFSGEIGASSSAGSAIIHHNGDSAALRGTNSGSVVLGLGRQGRGLTLVDKSLDAGNAIELAGGGDISIDNVVVQGFGACLAIGDTATQVAVSNSVFYCGETTLPAGDGTDYGSQVLAQASNFYAANPDLTTGLAVDNAVILDVTGANSIGGGTQVNGYEFGLYYEPCYGVGTPLEETVNIGQDSYNVCELKGQVADGNLYFDDDINGELVAWRLNGAVTLGSDFSALDVAQQQAALAEPQQVIMDGSSKILLDAGSALTLNPDVAFRVLGTAEDPVELAPQGPEANWGGITINGLADSCANAELCQLAQQQFVDVSYLRLLKAGNGQPTLALNEVSVAGQINYLDIADSASDGLALNGGAANIDNLLVADVVGNQVQWSNGYRGTLQYAILQSGDGSLGHALHGRNNADDHDAAPRSRPVMANITLKGADNADTAILLEQGSGLLLYNAVVADFNTCLDIDDQATANLQVSNPAEIFFDNVVLDCDTIVPAEEEDSGMDFATATRGLSGVYDDVAAVLDSNFVATGSDIPGIEDSIDFTLAGSAANYLNADVGYMGSVRDSVDDWYRGWSDSVSVQLAAECDFMGVLEDDYTFESDESFPIYFQDTLIGNAKSSRPVCGLRGTITEDLVLSTYTGSERLAAESGENITEETDYFGTPVTMVRDPVPTVWLMNGLVRVGEGHLEITDPAQMEAIKENPVTLEIEASADVVATAGGGLHITRGGALLALGEVDLEGGADTDMLGPVGLSGTGPWRGLIVDGFGRNNQCPDAMAEPGTLACNIQGEFGYYGGYDNSHGNLWVENLEMEGGRVQLNSVGGGSEIHNFAFASALSNKAEESFGKPVIELDGGAVNMRNLYIDSSPSSSRGITGGGVIRWNHGYQGTLQSLWLVMQTRMDFAGTDADGNYRTIYQETDGGISTTHFYPVIHGINGAAGHENDLPRSAPTIANLSLRYSEVTPERYPDALSTMIELSGGSGLYLHNSVLGTNKLGYERENTTSNPYPIGFGWAPDWCIKTDGSVENLVGEEVIFDQVALGCTQFSNSAGLEQAFNTSFASQTVTNVVGTASDLTTVKDPTEATADIYRFDWLVGNLATESDYPDVESIVRFAGWSNRRYAAPDVINLGEVAMDYSASKTVNQDFIEDTNYFGVLDYFIPINAGYQIEAD